MTKMLIVFLLANGLRSYSQDSLIHFDTKFLDSAILISGTVTYRTQIPFDYLDRSPDDRNREIVKAYGYLKNQQPTSKNYQRYYEVAWSLWELNKLKEAEQMFLRIIKSTEKHYSTQYHSSGTRYGYGSFTSSYKNSACIYLTKIYIIQKQFDKAFKYLEDATKKYKVTYSCGTGFYRQKNEYDFLYARCFEGQKKYDKVLALLLPECLDRNDDIIVRVIKKMYSSRTINGSLRKAEKAMRCTFDTFPSYSWTTDWENNRNTDSITYYSGSATIYLFGHVVDLPRPFLNDSERVTREHFIREFKESDFYIKLRKSI